MFSYYLCKKLWGHRLFKVMLFLPSMISMSVFVLIFSYFVDAALPYIFGINEKYSQNFFIDNKLDLKQKMVCIVDLDEKTFETIPKKYNIKEYPDIPKHFKEIIDNNIQQYYKYLINSVKMGITSLFPQCKVCSA